MKFKHPAGKPTAVALCTSQTDDHARVCVALNAQDGNVPEWVTLIPPGPLVQGRDGRNWTMPDAEAVVTASSAWAKSRGAPLDEEHSTQLSLKAPACGWFEEYRVSPEGAIQARVDWTELGSGFVSRREYRFISAAFDYDIDSREILCCIGGGLTNAHNLQVPALNKRNQEENMNPKLMSALGLTSTGNAATDLDLALNAIQALGDDKITALNANKEMVSKAQFDETKTALNKAKEKLKKIESDTFAAKVDTALNKAVEDGKLTPATRLKWEPTLTDDTALNNFESVVEAMPVLTTDQQVPKGDVPGSDTALNQAETPTSKLFGNTADDFEKYGADA